MPHVLENRPTATGAPALLGQLPGERLHNLEDRRGLPLVAGKRDAFRERVGDDDEALGGQFLDVDRPAGRNLVLLVGGEFDDRRLFLVPRELADDTLTQAANDVVFLKGSQSDEDDGSETEKG